MSDAAWFGIAVVALFVLRGIAGTVVFLMLLPQGSRCPACNEETLHVQSPRLNRLLPWFRISWCPRCQWEGLLRRPRGSGGSAGAARGATPLRSRSRRA